MSGQSASRDDLLSLAERCEKASGPDREVDREIERLVFGPEVDPMAAIEHAFAPAYTSSLDAAMTLVPGGEPWTVCLTRPDGVKAIASAHCGHERTGNCSWSYRASAEAATPSLALTAACLRARASA